MPEDVKRAPVRYGYADTDLGQVPYVEAGSGEPLVLLHLAPRSSRMFLPLLPLLADRHRCVAVDMLGFGEAPPIPMHDGRVDVLDVAGNVVQIMDDLGIEKAHLFGIHTGAHFACQAVANWPDRFASLSLVGLGMRETADEANNNSDIVSRYSEFADPAFDGSHLSRWWTRWYQDVLRYWLHARPLVEDPDAPDLVRRPMPFRPLTTFLRPDELLFIHRGVADAMKGQYNNWKQAYSTMMHVDMPALLSRITVPTVHFDPDSPYESPYCQRGDRVAQLVADGRAVTLEGVDEHVCELAPQVLAEPLLAFLEEHAIVRTPQAAL